MPKKRPLSIAEKKNFERCLEVPAASRDVVRKVWNIASELRSEAGVCGKTDSARVDTRRLAQAAECYAAHELPSWEGDSMVQVYLLDIQKAMTFMVRRSKDWENAMAILLEEKPTITPIWYLDDVHCGNILAPGGLKKISAYYASFKEFRSRLHSELSWLPVAALQRPQADSIRGGLSAVMKALLHFWRDKRFHLVCLGVARPVHVDAEASYYIGDMDSQKLFFCNKGSAGYKPCMWCYNLLKKGAMSQVPGAVEIDAPSLAVCCQAKDDEMFATWDCLAAMPHGGARKEAELIQGWGPMEDALLSDPIRGDRCCHRVER